MRTAPRLYAPVNPRSSSGVPSLQYRRRRFYGEVPGRLSHFLERARFDLPDAFARHVELCGKIFERQRLVGQMSRLKDATFAAVQDVVDMNRRLGGDKSINAPLHDDGQTGEWQDHLVDQSPSPEAIVVEQDEKDHRHKALIAAIDVLDDRERRIFEARHLADEPLTLEDLAEKFNVSRERIRQIEARAFEKVRKAARNLVVKAPPMQEAWGA